MSFSNVCFFAGENKVLLQTMENMTWSGVKVTACEGFEALTRRIKEEPFDFIAFPIWYRKDDVKKILSGIRNGSCVNKNTTVFCLGQKEPRQDWFSMFDNYGAYYIDLYSSYNQWVEKFVLINESRNNG